ncbi:nitric oxide synthase: salivary gland-like protein [Leptotrombidium deliense]|uniref:Nitric oxide synthase n=1 Tax=Leptotrombidium deliense TaxID=299467 RepID=A0A443SHT2_9ACAR|nr:nitric oxide synthase: salivary gland-like protein [Leptotrombidium deliense]
MIVDFDRLMEIRDILQPLHCTPQVCKGSLMTSFNSLRKEPRSTQDILKEANKFLEQYFTSIKRLKTPAHQQRWEEVVKEVNLRGTYTFTETELIFGAKLAWRNAPRCIGRIQWSKLQIFDARNVTTAKEMFDALCNHIKYSTNRGNIRSAITIFRQRTHDRSCDFRVWNGQLISYAGYIDQKTGEIIGDPLNVEFTQVCEKLGWRGKRTNFDVLPLVLSANGEDPQLFPIPEELVLRVPLKHPKYEWFQDLNLEWYALPAVSSMLLDLGGIEFPAVPFNGWFMVTEIGCRDLCDPHRYNILEKVAKKMGLDTLSNTTLWKDLALVEVNVAVMDSFHKAGVTIVDHHTASETFMKHLDNEQKLRGGCPADWVWIVPPTAGSLTPVFHQEMLYYKLKPSFEYQEPAWKHHQWKNKPEEVSTPMRKLKFKEIAKAVKFTSNLFGKALAKRVKATILYATETGKSEDYAQRLSHLFSFAFNVSVMCMDAYDTINLEHEALLLVVTSTFGNGDPPENGETFARQLHAIKVTGDTTPDVSSVRSQSMSYLRIASSESVDQPTPPPTDTLNHGNVGPLSNIRYAVFALGSSAYPKFCAFGRFIDNMLSDLGGERISKLATGDELCGQEQSFSEWRKEVFKVACETFCINDEIDVGEVTRDQTIKPQWTKESCKLQPLPKNTVISVSKGENFWYLSAFNSLFSGLMHFAKGTNRKILPFKLRERQDLHETDAENRKTITVQLEYLTNEAKITSDEDKPVNYLPGDHLGIYPENNRKLVEGIINRLNLTDCDVPIEILVLKESEDDKPKEYVPHPKLPHTTIRDALTRYLDITTPPSQQFLSLVLPYCSDGKEAELLNKLANDHDHYEEWKVSKLPHLLELLEEFPSLNPPPELLLTQLSFITPRFYSISSSPLYYSWQYLNTTMNGVPPRLTTTKSRPGTPTEKIMQTKTVKTEPQTPTGGAPQPFAPKPTLVDLTVSVVRYKTMHAADHYGVCSNFLADIPIGHKVFCFIRSAPNFRMPDDQSAPVIMVGPGTGIAPFRSFWLHRYAHANMNATEKDNFGKMSLFFGCRVPEMRLYADELQNMKDEGVLNDVFFAYSRVPNQPKNYVQDVMKNVSREVFRQIVHEKGHFYICGDVSMAKDVYKTLKHILEENGIKDTEATLMRLKEEMRYHEDIFGITLRTAEVTSKIRNEALTRKGLTNA